MTNRIFLFSLSVFFLISCGPNIDPADTIITNANIYTVDEANPKAQAVALRADTIIAVGSEEEILALKGGKTEVLDLQGKTMTPGLIESHAHIMGMGYNQLNVDLMYVQSYDELINMVSEASEGVPEGTWILGRGWHQDKWETQTEQRVKGFPTHHSLSKAVPDHPVYLSHASGHAGLANAKAMEIAGVTKDSDDPDGGEIFKDVSGNPTGVFNETAQGLIRKVVPAQNEETDTKALELAIEYALENGITSLQNAGADTKDINLFKKFGEEGKMGIRLWTMLNGRNDSLLNAYYKTGPEIGLYDDFLTVRSIKLYADGALGSRGAWLLEEYTDAPGVLGHNVMPMEDIRKVTFDGLENGFQVCTHAIGDRANREVLDIYESAFTEFPDKADDHRFRVEHAQHIDPEDIPRFSEMDVIASVQAIHMSSDRPWAIFRLGKRRIVNGAYVWRTLIESGAVVINGTDAPVEPVSAIASFYSSVTRQTLKGSPEGGYEPAQKMTREQALRTYTLWAAYGAFEEDIKGSIEVGKLADFTVYSQDLMTVPDDQLLDTEIDMTIVGGEVMYERSE
ncbi:MAG: amidohydrolase [Bacteroidota bacterium]